MARHPEDVQLQIVMVPWMRRALGKAAMKHQDDVDRHKLMERGPMLSYVAAWFLAQDDATQLRVIEAGKAEFDRRFSRRHGVTADPDLVDPIPAAKDVESPPGWTGVGPGLGSVGDTKADRKRADKAGRPARK